MITEKTYNGWKNYETWAVKLWLDNDEALYLAFRDTAADHMRRARMYPHNVFTVSEDARYGLADALKEWAEEDAPDLGGTVWGDLLAATMSEVDWADIADNMLSDADGYERAS